MNRSHTSTFLTKLFLISGILWFVIIDALIVLIYRKNPGHSSFVSPLDVFVTCVIAFTPLWVGMQGFFLVKNLMLVAHETDVAALKKLAQLFSFGIIAAYGALISLMVLLRNLRS
jgi:hypothetical protein